MLLLKQHQFLVLHVYKLLHLISLAIDEPTTLQTPKTNAPFDFANLIAAKVSAVSPDCEIAITTSFSCYYWISISKF